MVWSGLPGSDYWIDMREPHVFTSARSRKAEDVLIPWYFMVHLKSGATRTIPEPPICSKLLRSDMVQLSTNGFRDFRGGRLYKSICSIQVTWLVECRYQDSMSPSQRISSITLFCFGLRVRTSEMWRGVCQTKSNPMLQCALDVQHVQPVKWSAKVSSLVFVQCRWTQSAVARSYQARRDDPSVFTGVGPVISKRWFKDPAVPNTQGFCYLLACWSWWSCCSDVLQWLQRHRTNGFPQYSPRSQQWTHFQPQVHVSHLMDRGKTCHVWKATDVVICF